MVVAVVAAVDVGVGVPVSQVGMAVVGEAVGQVVEVVSVSLGSCLSVRCCLSFSISRPLANVVVVAIISSEGIWVAVVVWVVVWVDVAVGQVVEIVGISFRISKCSCVSFRCSNCVSLSSSFRGSLSISRPLANVVVVAVVASEGIWVVVVDMSVGKMGVWVDVSMVQVVEVVRVSLRISNCLRISSCFWSSNCLSLSSSFCRCSSKKEKSSSCLEKVKN